MSGREIPPRISATENIGPIARDCATACSVESFLSPNDPAPPAVSVWLMPMDPPQAPAPLAPGTTVVYKVRTSNVNSHGHEATGSRVSETTSGPLRVRSVVGLAYDELRAMIVDGRLEPGARVGQAELADALGISRGSVREALRRLAGDGLVVFEVNRGFFVADVGLERVLERLEARLLLEPGIARLAAERRDDDNLEALRRASTASGRRGRRRPPTTPAAPSTRRSRRDAQRRPDPDLRLALDRRRRRRLLASRRSQPDWQEADVAEHEELLEAVEARRRRARGALMRAHVESAWRHWARRTARRSRRVSRVRLVHVLSENWTLTPPRDLRALVRMAQEAEDAGFDAVMVASTSSSAGAPTPTARCRTRGTMRSPATRTRRCRGRARSSSSRRSPPRRRRCGSPRPRSSRRSATRCSSRRTSRRSISSPRAASSSSPPSAGTSPSTARSASPSAPRQRCSTSTSPPGRRPGGRLRRRSRGASTLRGRVARAEAVPARRRAALVRLEHAARAAAAAPRPVRPRLESARRAERRGRRPPPRGARGRRPRSGGFELVGGTRGRFPDADSLADLDEALATIPAQVERGFTSICIKPSQFLDDRSRHAAWCRESCEKGERLRRIAYAADVEAERVGGPRRGDEQDVALRAAEREDWT